MIRFFDILFSGIAIIILLPFMIPIMIGLKLTGEHDIFYKQTRIGKGGKPFGVIKFATMLRNSAKMPGGELTQKNDPRILPMGRFLRKTKINEVPQLLNIFIGQMSIIGPRPQVKRHYDLYSPEIKAAIDTVAPGLSGLGSVVFRDEEDLLNAVVDRDEFHDTVIAPYKGALEVWFVQHRTLGVYFKLIILTVLAVLNPSSKAWRKAFKGLPPVPTELEEYV